jgi:hypothetical protein
MLHYKLFWIVASLCPYRPWRSNLMLYFTTVRFYLLNWDFLREGGPKTVVLQWNRRCQLLDGTVIRLMESYLVNLTCLDQHLLRELIARRCRPPEMLILPYSHRFANESWFETFDWCARSCWLSGWLTLAAHMRRLSRNEPESRSLTQLCIVAFSPVWSLILMTAVDKMISGNIFSILACRRVWYFLRHTTQLPNIHSSEEWVSRRQLEQRFFSLTRCDLSGTDSDKNCLQFRIAWGPLKNCKWLGVGRDMSGSTLSSVYCLGSWHVHYTDGSYGVVAYDI